MAITPVCDKFGEELIEFGGILFSPPNKKSEVKKWHLCKACYRKVPKDFGKYNK